MGVDVNVYLMFGRVVPFEQANDEKFQNEWEGNVDRRFDLVLDMMMGEMAVAGKILAEVDGKNADDEMRFFQPERLTRDTAVEKAVHDAFGGPMECSVIMFTLAY